MVLLALAALLISLATALAAFTEYLSSKQSVLKAAQFAFQMSMVFYFPELQKCTRGCAAWG